MYIYVAPFIYGSLWYWDLPRLGYKTCNSVSYHHYPHQERRVHREKDEDRNFVGVNIYHGLVKEYTLHL